MINADLLKLCKAHSQISVLSLWLSDTCFSIEAYFARLEPRNPLTPMSDQDRISPCNENTISSRRVIGIKNIINQGITSWSNTNLFELAS